MLVIIFTDASVNILYILIQSRCVQRKIQQIRGRIIMKSFETHIFKLILKPEAHFVFNIQRKKLKYYYSVERAQYLKVPLESV